MKGETGIVSSARDLVTYAENLRSLRADEKRALTGEAGSHYTNGWLTARTDAAGQPVIVTHDGDTVGFNSSYTVDLRENGLSVITLSNDERFAGAYLGRAEEIIFGRDIDLED